jgi:hypothetical protein
MTQSARFALSVTLLLLAFAPFAHATDDSVASRLEARGFQAEVDEDGDYKVVLSYPDQQRTQIVFVGGRTESIGGFTVREVFAPAARLSDGIDGDRALELMSDSRNNKLGSGELGGDILYFVIKLPDELDAERLEVAMNIAASVADDMERELTGTDEL